MAFAMLKVLQSSCPPSPACTVASFLAEARRMMRCSRDSGASESRIPSGSASPPASPASLASSSRADTASAPMGAGGVAGAAAEEEDAAAGSSGARSKARSSDSRRRPEGSPAAAVLGSRRGPPASGLPRAIRSCDVISLTRHSPGMFVWLAWSADRPDRHAGHVMISGSTNGYLHSSGGWSFLVCVSCVCTLWHLHAGQS